MSYNSIKDTAIALYRDFVDFLRDKGVVVPEVQFPPIPIANTFERLMFIAKYLQDRNHKISKLTDILFLSKDLY